MEKEGIEATLRRVDYEGRQMTKPAKTSEKPSRALNMKAGAARAEGIIQRGDPGDGTATYSNDR